MKKIVLLLASYIFYAAWNPPFVVLLWFSTIIDWVASGKIATSHTPGRKRIWLAVSLLANLGLLAFFKYGNFVLSTLNWVMPVTYSFDTYSIILPVGISFYTFQTLSYTLDIYRGEARPWHSFLDYALYVTFFPQLVAGPIVRSGEFLEQCKENKTWNADNVGYGAFWLVAGLFLKMVVADYFLAPVVEAVYQTDGQVSALTAWTGTVAFSIQILCDFAGYSIAAIGIARMLGFQLPKNFRFPYAATSFSDFWRRWHISLSTWLRDYLYIPMGGNRKGNLRTYQNLLMTMLIGGLWHGASWTFVVWGGLHGVYLMAERSLKNSGLGRQSLPPWLGVLLVYALTCLTWVFFRANSFQQAFFLIQSMLGAASFETVVVGTREIAITGGILGATLLISWWAREKDLEERVRLIPAWQFVGLSVLLLYLIITLPGEDRSFIYFQF